MGERRRVVITGMGLVTALGEKLEPFWQNILSGRSGVKVIEAFDTTDYTVHIGGEVTEFDAGNYGIDHRDAKRMDRFAQFAVAASISAMNDSGLEAPTAHRTPAPRRAALLRGPSRGDNRDRDSPRLRTRCHSRMTLAPLRPRNDRPSARQRYPQARMLPHAPVLTGSCLEPSTASAHARDLPRLHIMIPTLTS